MISVRDVSFRYPDQAAVLQSIRIDIPSGVNVLLLGPNGCGKTTLMGILSGYLKPAAGCVTLDGMQPHKLSARARLAAVMVVSQRYHFEVMATTVQDELLRQASRVRLSSDDIRAAVSELPDTVRLAYESARLSHPLDLTPSQLWLVLLGIACVVNPRHLLLDEVPALDMTCSELEGVETVLASRRSAGVTTLISTHGLRHFVSTCDSVLVFGERTQGPVHRSMDSLLSDPAFRELFLTNGIHAMTELLGCPPAFTPAAGSRALIGGQQC